MNYQELTIDFVGKSASGDGYNVKVESSLGYSAEQEIVIPEAAFDNAGTLEGLVRGETRKAEIDTDINVLEPEAYGEQLFEALFTGDVRRVYDKASGSVTDAQDSGLRIKLQFSLAENDDAKLAEIPWELMRDSAEMQYLSLNRRTPIVRYVNAQQRLNLEPLAGALRVLVVMASPRGEAQLDLAAEKARIQEGWAADQDVEVTFLEHATRQALQEIIPGYHVMHFMGHGVHSDGGGGAIVLEDEDGNADPLDADRLGQWVKGESLRLVVLNACETAKSSEGKPFASVAPRLVMAGIPAVIAMQFPISDDAAIDFSKMFYKRLVMGDPVDEATARGRGAISAGHGGEMEWGTPVLFMRAPNGQLFSNNHSQEVMQSTISGVTPVSLPEPEQTVSGGVGPVGSTAAPASTAATTRKKKSPVGLIAGGVVLALLVAVVVWIMTFEEASFEFAGADADVVTSVNTDARLMLVPTNESFSASEFRNYQVEVDGDYSLTFYETESLIDGWRITVSSPIEGRFEVKARVISEFDLSGLDEQAAQSLREKTPWIRTTVQFGVLGEVLDALGALQQQVADPSVSTEALYTDIYDFPYVDQLGSYRDDYENLLQSMGALYQAKIEADAAFDNRMVLVDNKIQRYADWLAQLESVRGIAAEQGGEGAEQLARLQQLQSVPRLNSIALCHNSDNFCAGETIFSGRGIYPAIKFPPAFRNSTLVFESYQGESLAATFDFQITNNGSQIRYFPNPGTGDFMVAVFNEADDMIWAQDITVR